jgi:DNA-3-methyladenine glycosylase II
MLDPQRIEAGPPAVSERSFTIEPRGPFSLQAALTFASGWEAAAFGDAPDSRSVRLAFVLDDFSGHAHVTLHERGGLVIGEVSGTSAVAVAAAQTARIMSLDADGSGYPEIGRRDPVVAKLQAQRPGLRPVGFHSPYEAAAWSIISARTPHAAARKLRAQLAMDHGHTFGEADAAMHAFPLPGQVLAISGAVPGLPEEKLRRLKDVAQAALDGLLDPQRLRFLERGEADRQLQSIRGIGPFYSSLILLRSCGVVDLAVTTEKRLQARIAQLYGADADPDAVTEGWRPFRTWTAVLLRSTWPAPDPRTAWRGTFR